MGGITPGDGEALQKSNSLKHKKGRVADPT